MARKTPLTSLKQMSEINLTPLMDLTFILLITFIITFPLIEQGIVVNLPKGKADKMEPSESQTISVDKDNQIYLNDHKISLEDLKTRVFELKEADPDVPVMVRADERITYGELVKVLKILHEAHITKMALVTQEE